MKHYGSRTSLLHPHYERGFTMIPIDGTNFKSDMRELNRHDQAVSELRKYAQQRDVTLLYGAQNLDYNNAVALKAFVWENVGIR